MKNKNKVFCCDCRYFNADYYTPACRHPNNITKKKHGADTWYKPASESKIFMYAPPDLNHNNDCKWYEFKIEGSYISPKHTQYGGEV